MAHIIAGRDAGGFRDFLDGREIHAGDLLEVWIAGAWVECRYECDFQTESAIFYSFAFNQPNETEAKALRINRAELWFRWPQK